MQGGLVWSTCHLHSTGHVMYLMKSDIYIATYNFYVSDHIVVELWNISNSDGVKMCVHQIVVSE